MYRLFAVDVLLGDLLGDDLQGESSDLLLVVGLSCSVMGCSSPPPTTFFLVVMGVAGSVFSAIVSTTTLELDDLDDLFRGDFDRELQTDDDEEGTADDDDSLLLLRRIFKCERVERLERAEHTDESSLPPPPPTKSSLDWLRTGGAGTEEEQVRGGNSSDLVRVGGGGGTYGVFIPFTSTMVPVAFQGKRSTSSTEIPDALPMSFTRFSKFFLVG